ncbi:hypothetical protein KKC08_05230 [Patescibacteria group bacterium]|nr:hypothetical protein [Patescibacteria group bacterium]MCG2702230.1 hypothetical protein [Candidatus Parcubacteria bacterium]MBU4264756.1 hypothetical protein [Patescibacteria group bacterium]MBU4390094.1 hypothetical protein [Patescibacteria group bacterium]MBU4397540.1 hypothetical protein [Patescibacteria group bacterium]
MNIKVNSHDFLGKLSIIKNCLALILDDKKQSDKNSNLLQKAYDSNQDLINLIKNTTIHG